MNDETKKLLAEIKIIEDDPKSKDTSDHLWIFTKIALRKLDDLRRKVASNIREERLSRGQKVNDSGYSGRKSNR